MRRGLIHTTAKDHPITSYNIIKKLPTNFSQKFCHQQQTVRSYSTDSYGLNQLRADVESSFSVDDSDDRTVHGVAVRKGKTLAFPFLNPDKKLDNTGISLEELDESIKKGKFLGKAWEPVLASTSLDHKFPTLTASSHFKSWS